MLASPKLTFVHHSFFTTAKGHTIAVHVCHDFSVKLGGCIASRGTSYAILNLLEMLGNVLKMAGNEHTHFMPINSWGTLFRANPPSFP